MSKNIKCRLDHPRKNIPPMFLEEPLPDIVEYEGEKYRRDVTQFKDWSNSTTYSLTTE